MDTAIDIQSGADLLRFQSLKALRRGVPEGVVDYCASATGRRFSSWLDVPLTPQDAARMRSYFRGVVRHRTIRSRGPELLSQRQRYILVSLAEDLRGVGAGRERLLRELGDVYGATVSDARITEVVDSLEHACA